MNDLTTNKLVSTYFIKKIKSEKQIRAFGKDNHVLYDIKYLLKANESDGRL